jgi:hypothetical protein
MRRAKIVLVAILTIALAGCVLSGKPKTVAAPPAVPQPVAATKPPEPLSIPQTDVKLPAPQPVVRDALNTTTPEEPPPPAPAKPPASTTPRAPSRPGGAPLPKTPPELPPAAAPEPEQPPRAPIQEILSPDEQKSYKDRAHKFQTDTHSLLSGAKLHTTNQKRQEQEINNFLKQSEQAESSGDLRLALQLAERAYTLAKELQGGK